MLEGYNSQLKRALLNHNGLSDTNKKKFIDGFLNVVQCVPYEQLTSLMAEIFSVHVSQGTYKEHSTGGHEKVTAGHLVA